MVELDPGSSLAVEQRALSLSFIVSRSMPCLTYFHQQRNWHGQESQCDQVPYIVAAHVYILYTFS